MQKQKVTLGALLSPLDQMTQMSVQCLLSLKENLSSRTWIMHKLFWGFFILYLKKKIKKNICCTVAIIKQALWKITTYYNARINDPSILIWLGDLGVVLWEMEYTVGGMPVHHNTKACETGRSCKHSADHHLAAFSFKLVYANNVEEFYKVIWAEIHFSSYGWAG